MNNRLLELREEKHLSQYEVAQILKVTRQAYSRYERGERELGYQALSTLSQFFDVSVDYLLGISDYYYPDHITTQYSPEERKLVEDYRGLAKPLKELLQDMIRSWQENTRKENFRKES